MAYPSIRLVLDTNVLLRGLVASHALCGKLLEAIDRRAALVLLSKPVLAEYRAVLTNGDVVARFPELTPEKVEIALRRLRFLGELVRTAGVRYVFDRDPRDAKLIELAIAGDASHIITFDNDLLMLPAGHISAAKRFRQRLPRTEILRADQFVHAFGRQLALD